MFDRRASFRHGVHPPSAKEETRDQAIHQFPFAPVLMLPLATVSDHLARPVVVEGQEVERGEMIAEPDARLSVTMHAPATGRVRRIALAPTIQGKMQPAIFIEPFAASTQAIAGGTPCDLSASQDEVIEAIRGAGAVGLGGAAFPTHAKLQAARDRPVDVILINGAECEPYLTSDYRVMLEHADDVVTGIRYLLRASGAQRAVVAIESDKADAAHRMSEAIAAMPAAPASDGPPSDIHSSERQGASPRLHTSLSGGPPSDIDVELLQVKYPQGAEKILIAAVLGRQVPSRGLPIDVGTLCFNVASAAEIGRCLSTGTGLVDRVLTVGGPAVEKRGNYRVPLGTPLRFLLETVGMTDEAAMVFLGGPMMGQAVSSLEIPIGKGTTGVIAVGPAQTAAIDRQRRHPCIRCGYCVDACPMFLNPAQLGLLAQRQRYQSMESEHHLMDCFECGCCSYVCPSQIPLVQQFRVAKAALRR